MDRHLFFLTICLALAIAGWLVGHRAGAPNASPVATNAMVETAASEPEPVSSDPAPMLDPAAIRDALEKTIRVEESSRKLDDLYEVAQRLRADDFPLALSALRNIGGKDAAKLWNELAAFWFERDAISARAWLETLPPDEQQKAFAAIFETWTRIDLSSLLAWLGKLSPEVRSRLVTRVRRDLCSLVAKFDPVRANELLAATPLDGSVSRDWPPEEWVVFSEWAKRDPAAAVAALEAMSSSGRLFAVSGLIEGWTERDQQATRDWIETLTDAPLIREANHSFTRSLSKSDPAGAANFMIEHWDHDFIERGIFACAIHDLCTRDAAKALAWVKGLADPEIRRQGLYEYFSALPDSEAVELWHAEYDGAKDARGWDEARNIANSLFASEGFDAAMAFIESVQPQMRDIASRDVIASAAREHGAVETARMTLGRSSGTDRADSIEWAFYELAREGQMGEVKQLLTTLQSPAEREAAIIGVLREEMHQDVDSAWELSQTLTEPVEARRLFLAQLTLQKLPLGLWDAKEDLKKWVQSTPRLTDGEKQRILGGVRK